MQTTDVIIAHCRICGDPLNTNSKHCPTCDTPHHPECWKYNSGCAVYGCGSSGLKEVGVRILLWSSIALVSSWLIGFGVSLLVGSEELMNALFITLFFGGASVWFIFGLAFAAILDNLEEKDLLSENTKQILYYQILLPTFNEPLLLQPAKGMICKRH